MPLRQEQLLLQIDFLLKLDYFSVGGVEYTFKNTVSLCINTHFCIMSRLLHFLNKKIILLCIKVPLKVEEFKGDYSMEFKHSSVLKTV